MYHNYQDLLKLLFQKQILENCIFGETKFLYVSPERLASEIFQVKLRHIHVSFITIDEAHCISQWGHHFRPEYRALSFLRSGFPEVPRLALTATADARTVDDIRANTEASFVEALKAAA